MAVGRVDDDGAGLAQPAVHEVAGVIDRKWAFEDGRTRGAADDGKDYDRQAVAQLSAGFSSAHSR